MAGKKAAFGGMVIKVDENLSKVFGMKVGSTIAPMEMSKKLWKYINDNGLKSK